MTKRMFIVALVFTLAFGAIIGKMAWAQLFQGAQYASQSFDNRASTVSLEAVPRGDILDRNGISLLGTDYEPALIILPKLVADPQQLLADCQRLLPELNITSEALLPRTTAKATYYPKPIIRTITDLSIIPTIKQLNEPAAIIAPYKTRYGSQSLAHHLVGYLDHQGHGVKGLEKAYDQQLSDAQPQRMLTPITDAKNQLLAGLGYRLVENNDLENRHNLWLTIDHALQEKLEQTFDQNYIIKGAAVILDNQSGQILAAVSRPLFNPSDLSETYGFNDNQLERALGIDYTYYPGSTFKLLTALIALEEGIADRNTIFTCDNQPPYNKCPRGHDVVDFTQALKVSCNNYFIHLGQQIGGTKLHTYLVDQLQFQLQVGKKLDSFAARANGVIGQELFKASPLQMANISAMIANDGVFLPIGNPIETRLVMGCVPDQQPPQLPLNDSSSFSVFSATTTQSLQDMLYVQETLTQINGTGQTISYAGKSGTPEIYSRNGQKSYLAWYTGYTPADHPQYAIAIVIEEIAGIPTVDLSGGKHALPLFKQLAAYLGN